jgi:hypothetical protein
LLKLAILTFCFTFFHKVFFLFVWVVHKKVSVLCYFDIFADLDVLLLAFKFYFLVFNGKCN